MSFDLIDVQNWDRRERYEHFINDVVCTFSLTINLDITNLIGKRLYPTMLWLITDTVNEMPEFRTALKDEGLGVYDKVNPSYTIFNKDTKNFSVIWTDFNEDYSTFLADYATDVGRYSVETAFNPKGNKPEDTIAISTLTMATFTSFNINVYNQSKFLLPVFTMGKFFEQDGKRLLPLAIQVHHAACDGYHAGCFVQRLQEKVDGFVGV